MKDRMLCFLVSRLLGSIMLRTSPEHFNSRRNFLEEEAYLALCTSTFKEEENGDSKPSRYHKAPKTWLRVDANHLQRTEVDIHLTLSVSQT
jgi:hypothetical protein